MQGHRDNRSLGGSEGVGPQFWEKRCDGRIRGDIEGAGPQYLGGLFASLRVCAGRWLDDSLALILVPRY